MSLENVPRNIVDNYLYDETSIAIYTVPVCMSKNCA